MSGLTKLKWGRHKLSISGMKKRLTVDPLAITKIIKGYYEEFYANKIKILNEMDELLEK